jgi:hypothetical protein
MDHFLYRYLQFANVLGLNVQFIELEKICDVGGGDFFFKEHCCTAVPLRVHIYDLLQSIFIGCFFACRLLRVLTVITLTQHIFKQVFFSTVTVKMFGNSKVLFYK